MKRKILLSFLIVFGAIQFIRPDKNTGGIVAGNDITDAVDVPADVQQILKISCYNCHSNHTNHPWYTNIQPAGWWMGNHISDGKKELNFSEFNSYSQKRKLKKFKEIADEVGEDEMPLSSYTLIHSEARLTEAQKQLLISWANDCENSLSERSE